MNYISISEASKRYKKSISTIKRALKGAEPKHLKQGEKLNTGYYKVLVSIDLLNELFGTTENTKKEPNNDLLETYRNELLNKQKIIDKLLQNQEALIENERNFQILLERANQRTELLEQHFNRNKKLTVDPEEKNSEEIIEELKEEQKPNLDSSQVPNDRATFNEWLKAFKG